MEGSGNYSSPRPMCAHHPLRFARLYRSSSRAKAVDAASGEGEVSEFCRIADAPVGLFFCFCVPVSSNEKREKVTEREKTICRHCCCEKHDFEDGHLK